MINYALIPARAGSKGVKNKNLKLLKGEPLIVYSIKAALSCKNVNKVIVTTDSLEIAEIAKKSGAEVPFLRPVDLAQDKSGDREYIEHAIKWFEENKDKSPDLISILRPTTPIRDYSILDLAIEKIIKNYNQSTSLRSVQALPEPPQKMMQFNGDFLEGFFPDDKRPEYFNLPRQTFPTAYQPNGYIDIVKTDYIKNSKHGIFGTKILGFETPYSVEIDTQEEFDYLEFLLGKKS